MIDQYESFTDTVSSPANHAFAVTPDDNAELIPIPKALYVGTGGDIVLCAKGDSEDVTFVAVPSGSLLPVRAHFIRATGTTASDIVAIG